MNKTLLIKLISSILIFLWVYAACSKLLDPDQSRVQMMNQVFPAFINRILLWAIPFIELFAAGLLLFPGSRRAGLILSAILLLLFTGYIVLVLLNVFDRIPCSCGGIISKLDWGEHLVFNLVFLGLALLSLVLYKEPEFDVK
jgi:hypothetical protein